jgi:S-adenosylmethionine:tRNA ribosyltransferase-isomerase
MERQELFFDLPADLIAQTPSNPRDACKLLLVDRHHQTLGDDIFFNLESRLKAGDVLVFNQSKVIPSRLVAKKETGGLVEVLLLRDFGEGIWSCLYGGKVKEGAALDIHGVRAEVLPRAGADSRIKLPLFGPALMNFLFAHGKMPTPPYIKELVKDQSEYQTVYAKEDGSAAAPTAGLHFTQDLLERLAKKGVQQEFVTLHVGLGTFQPVKAERVEDHQIHSEWYSIDQEVFKRLQQAKKEGRRIIAVGTTSVRVLETVFSVVIPTGVEESLSKAIPPLHSRSGRDDKITGETSIFIYPGYQFKAVDALITNFHTPYSSLLALVYAFAGQELIRKAYQHAIDKKYRFFSFGDAMFIE